MVEQQVTHLRQDGRDGRAVDTSWLARPAYAPIKEIRKYASKLSSLYKIEYQEQPNSIGRVGLTALKYMAAGPKETAGRLLLGSGCEVDPVSWTPEHLRSR